MSQKVLCMTTPTPTFRSAATGWTAEDSSLFEHGKPIGRTPGFRGSYTFENPLHAMACGWKLLAPPSKSTFFVDGEDGKSTPITEWEWYFTKE